MHLTSPPAPFTGTIDAYIERCVVPNLPPAEALAAWTDALLDYYAGPDPMCVVRGRAGSRGAPFRQGGDRVVYGDNSPGRWCTLRALDGAVLASDIGARIDAGDIPVAFALRREERAARTWGALLSPRDRDMMSQPRLKHCHIDGALKDAPPSPRVRALRNLCPMNHFLWPMPTRFDMHRVGWSEQPSPKDLGESPTVIAWVRARLAAHLDGAQREVLRRYIRAIQGGSGTPSAGRVIRITAKSAATSPQRPEPTRARRRRRTPPPPAASPAPRRTGTVNPQAYWDMALQPATPLAAAEVLARHPRHAELTARLFPNGVTARRVVALANTLHNAARPSNVEKRGESPTPDHLWSIVQARIDAPHGDRPSKWRGPSARPGDPIAFREAA